MTFRYIGSKTRLIEQLKAYIGQPQQGAFFVDAFCGTGVVAEAAADLGWNVRINDSLYCAVISAGARLISREQVGNRVASSLRLSYNPIRVDANGTRAIDFAGLIRLAPSLELEVAPKFLGLDDTDTAWREDFFFLSTLSRHGKLLVSERLSASGGTPRDLSTLVARSITSMYAARKRRPLRNYRVAREADFFIDGDPDPVDFIFPSPDGFEQEIVRLDRRSGWNADLVAAAKELLPEVSDPSAVSSLVRLIKDLSPQNAPAKRRKPIPARHRAWKPLHDLSVDVLGGLGLNYKQGGVRAPGYLVDTWRVWEDLLTVGARLGFGRSAVLHQNGYPLGTRAKFSTGAVSKILVYPDCVIESDGVRPMMLLDAKYKGHVERGRLRISELNRPGFARHFLAS